MSEDAALLRRYARNGDGLAFRQLVERHLALVYASALRQVGGDRLLAEDVTQNVFHDLARHAGQFEPDALVVPWLYRATRFAASNVVRTERRRRAREHAYAEDMAMTASTTTPIPAANTPPMEDACAQMDDAVHALEDRDREAILLRYFQGLDLEAVGAALQTSANTAQKRVSRALEKLRLLLVQRGVALSVTALSTFLADQATAAPPPGLADTIAKEVGQLGAAAETGAGVASAPAAGSLGMSLSTGAGIAAAVVLGGALLFALWRHTPLATASSSSRGLPPGLVSWWTGDGHPGDDTGRNPALLLGNVTYAPGVAGQAFHFDGMDGTQLLIPDHPSLNLTNEITLSLWFRPDDDSNMGTILVKRGPSGPRPSDALINYALHLGPVQTPEQWGIAALFNDITLAGGYHLSQTANGTNYYVTRRNLIEQLAFFPTPRRSLDVLRGQWHHLAGVFRQLPGTQVEIALYYDGQPRARQAVPGTLASTLTSGPLHLGGFDTAWYKGSLDDIRLYNRALPGPEIQRLATRSIAPPQHARQ